MKFSSFVFIILAIHIAFWISAIFDISFMRQVIGSLYLLFIPGLVVLATFGLGRHNLIENLLFALGLSIVLTMVIGVIDNELLPLLGIVNPLSETNIMLFISIFTLSLCSSSLLTKGNRDLNVPMSDRFLNLKTMRSIVVLSLVSLSVVGALLVDPYKGTMIDGLLLLMMLLIFLIVLIYKKQSTTLYPAIILIMAIAFAFSKALSSNYIIGFDIHKEYFVMKTTINSHLWKPFSFSGDPFFTYASFSSMMSITVLPTVFSVLLGLSETWLFKIIYPIIYSFVPIGVYQFHSKQIGKSAAFISVFFLMANFDVFLQPLANGKQIIAELFLIMLIIALIDIEHKHSKHKNQVLVGMLSFGLIVSHYSTSYLFLGIAGVVWLYDFLQKKRTKFPLSFIVLFFVIAFSWYIYTSQSSPFDKLTGVGDNIYQNLFRDLLNIQSRGTETNMLIAGSDPSILHEVSRIMFLVTLLFILVGLLGVTFRVVGDNFEGSYRTTLYVAAFALLLVVAIPNVASSLRTSRFYGILLLLLAPLFVLGVRTFSKVLSKRARTQLETLSLGLIIVVLVPFFLLQTGLVYELAGDPFPTNPSISMYRMGDILYTERGYVRESDVFGATWVSMRIPVDRMPLFSDEISRSFVLASYGMVPTTLTFPISETTVLTKGSYVFLSMYNHTVIIRGRVVNTTGKSIISNKLYSNGYSHVELLLVNSTIS